MRLMTWVQVRERYQEQKEGNWSLRVKGKKSS